MSDGETQSEIIRDLLQNAIPVNPVPHGTYITREELATIIANIDSKIENAALRQKHWVLTGVLAIIVTFGGGYVSLMSKIDYIAESVPAISKRVEQREPWMRRQEFRDAQQDAALQRVDPKYEPLGYDQVTAVN